MHRLWILITVVALYVLRFDFWLWQSPRLIFGLPVGLLYHLLFCLLVALTLALILRFFWPLGPATDQRSR